MKAKHTPIQYDAMLDAVVAKSADMQVPWFLMASWLYYHADVTLLTDERYDRLAKDIDAQWDTLRHRHKQVIDHEALSAGTQYSVKDSAYPTIIVDAACALAGIKAPRVIPRAQYANQMRGEAPPPANLPPARVRTRNPVLQPVAAARA